MNWRQQARCREGVADRNDFFPNRESLAGPPAWLVELCGGCPVRAQCLERAIETRSTGLWAATTSSQRRAATRG